MKALLLIVNLAAVGLFASVTASAQAANFAAGEGAIECVCPYPGAEFAGCHIKKKKCVGSCHYSDGVNHSVKACV